MYNDFSKVAKHLNNNIIISRPDKGTGGVLLQKDKYLDKMMTILGDKNIFLQLGPVISHDNTS